MVKKESGPEIDKTLLRQNTLKALLKKMEDNPPLGVTYEHALREIIKDTLLSESKSLSKADQEKMGDEIYDYVNSFDMIKPLLDDSKVSEIMINGCDCVYKEIN